MNPNAQTISAISGSRTTIVNGGIFTVNARQEVSEGDSTQLSKVLDWLSPDNFRAFQKDIYNRHAPGTGRKLLESSEFRGWLESPGAILWGTGILGAGKTVLASIVVNHIQEIALASVTHDICVGFAYCRYTMSLGVTDILGAVLRQLLERLPSVEGLIGQHYASHSREKTRPSISEFLEVFREISSRFRVYIVLDAPDEVSCSERQFTILDALTSFNANLFITSRPLPLLKPLVSSRTRKFIEVGLSAQDDDIERVVRQKIEMNPSLARILCDSAAQRQIISSILKKSNGMFLHAVLQIEAVRDCLTAREIRARLDTTPEDLNRLYEQAVERIQLQAANKSALAKKALVWVIHAKRPLKLVEISAAVSNSFNEDDIVDGETLLSLCCGLLEIQPESGTISLIHQTARESLRQALIDDYEDPDSSLLSTCLRCLRHFGLEVVPDDWHTKPNLYWDLFKSHPFLTYAYHFWHVHAKLAGPKVHDDIVTFIRGCKSYPLLDESGFWTGMLNPVHIVALYDLPNSISTAIISTVDVRAINAKSPATKFGEGTPLLLAARGGREHVVQQLLERPGLNVEGEIGFTILAAAVGCYQASIVDLLLADRRIDATRKSSSGARETILFYTFPNPDEAILSKLLEHRPAVDVNARHRFGRTVLGLFVTNKRVAHVRRLLEHPDVDVNAKDTYPLPPKTALQLAVEASNKEIVKLVMGHPKLIVDKRSWEWRRALELTDILPSSNDHVST